MYTISIEAVLSHRAVLEAISNSAKQTFAEDYVYPGLVAAITVTFDPLNIYIYINLKECLSSFILTSSIANRWPYFAGYHHNLGHYLHQTGSMAD